MSIILLTVNHMGQDVRPTLIISHDLLTSPQYNINDNI